MKFRPLKLGLVLLLVAAAGADAKPDGWIDTTFSGDGWDFWNPSFATGVKVDDLAVRPDGQGTGIGQRLLGEAERIARDDWHCAEMRMTVIDIRNELVAWYERRGYQRTGEHKPFPYGDERFGIPLRDDLRFEVLRKPLA